MIAIVLRSPCCLFRQILREPVRVNALAFTAMTAFAALFGAGGTMAAEQAEYSTCGALQLGGYGPFDYRTATPFERNIVEGAHFTPDVANLKAGASGSIGGDIVRFISKRSG